MTPPPNFDAIVQRVSETGVRLYNPPVEGADEAWHAVKIGRRKGLFKDS